ncbi:MAG: hypothetical protein V7K27_29275 [Nostoc sp.]|uniref:hypothetical protein n=1 Tax=Nostoc sp. TaxID=1180 RepID=UPI002FF9F593
MLQSSNQRLTLEEFLALPEGDITYRFHQIITDDLLPELEITPHAIFQRAGLNP